MRKMYAFIYMTSKVYEFTWNEYLSLFSHFGYFPLRFLQNWTYSHPWVRMGTSYKSVQTFELGLWSLKPLPVCVPWHYWTSYGARFDHFMTIKTFSK